MDTGGPVRHNVGRQRSTPDMTSNTQQNLYGLIRACQRGQHVAVVGSTNDDNQLRNDLYIPQPEDEKVTNFFADDYETDGKLLVLTGSAGDGKSALLSRGYDACVTDLPKKRINMDATAARARTGEYTERLDEFFSTVIPDVRASEGPRSGLAINYGLAVDYFERQAHSTSADAGEVWDTLRESQTAKEVRTDNVHVINLSHRRTYNSHPDQLGAGLVRQLLDRFDPTTKNSPFTTAYEQEQDHCPAGADCPLLYNVNQLTDENTKDNIARVLAGWSIARGAYLNPRTIIDYISSMVLPTAMHDVEDHSSCPIGAAIAADRVDPTAEMLLWNAVFKQLGTMSAVEESRLDPASHTDLETDQEILSWGGDQTDGAFANCAPSDEFTTERAAEIRTVLRSRYLTAGEGTTELDEKAFQEFAGALTYFQNDAEELRSEAQNFVQTTKQALSNWTGRKQDSELVEFVDGERSTDYRFLSP